MSSTWFSWAFPYVFFRIFSPQKSLQILLGFTPSIESLARQCKNSIPPLEFSHRAFRLHLNLCTDTIERLLKQILLETLSTYHNLPKDVSSALQLFDSTWRNCDEINHCLSLLELIMQLMAYFNSLRQPPKSHGGINEEITFRVEDAQLQNFQLRWEFLHDKIKVIPVILSSLSGCFLTYLDHLNDDPQNHRLHPLGGPQLSRRAPPLWPRRWRDYSFS